MRDVSDIRAMRLPVLFMLVGLAVKGLLVILWRFSQSPELLALLTDYDPVAFQFAEKSVALFFDPRRIAPGDGEALLFEIMLVVAFGLECMIIGFVTQALIRRRWRRSSESAR